MEGAAAKDARRVCEWGGGAKEGRKEMRALAGLDTGHHVLATSMIRRIIAIFCCLVEK